jgi:hypothetical protein
MIGTCDAVAEGVGAHGWVENNSDWKSDDVDDDNKPGL